MTTKVKVRPKSRKTCFQVMTDHINALQTDEQRIKYLTQILVQDRKLDRALRVPELVSNSLLMDNPVLQTQPLHIQKAAFERALAYVFK